MRIDLEAERAASLARIAARERRAWERVRERLSRAPACAWGACTRRAVRYGYCSLHAPVRAPKPKPKKPKADPRIVATAKAIRQHFDGTAQEYLDRQHEIIKRADAGQNNSVIARDFGISHGAVKNVLLKRERWEDPAFAADLLRYCGGD